MGGKIFGSQYDPGLSRPARPSPEKSRTVNRKIFLQVSAALQGQPVTVRQTGSPVRIQTSTGTPLMAVSVQSTPQQSTSGNEQVGIPRLQKKPQ